MTFLEDLDSDFGHIYKAYLFLLCAKTTISYKFGIAKIDFT